MWSRFSLIVVFAVAASGCRAQQLRTDQDQFRHALLQMQTDQIMDNLVRAHNGFPIVHMEYTQITGTITHNAQTDVNPSFANAAGAITNAIAATFTGSQQNQLAVTGNPVVDPNVYLAYLEFLERPNRLVVTTESPPECAAHVCQEHCGSFYWIPAEYRIEFLELSLKTSGMRGQPIVASDFVTVSVTDAKRRALTGADLALAPGQVVYLDVTIDTEIKADRGKVQFKTADRFYSLDMIVGDVTAGAKTTQIVLRYKFGNDSSAHQIPTSPDDMARLIVGASLQVYPATFRPDPPTSEVLLNSINHQLGLIRMHDLGR